jgi:uncharacterized CHY-type Zn-finger protein
MTLPLDGAVKPSGPPATRKFSTGKDSGKKIVTENQSNTPNPNKDSSIAESEKATPKKFTTKKGIDPKTNPEIKSPNVGEENTDSPGPTRKPKPDPQAQGEKLKNEEKPKIVEEPKRLDNPSLPKTSKPLREPTKRPAVKDNSIESEINQLKIRFPDLIHSLDPKTKHTLVEFNLPITDPDFPYDLPFAHLQCTLPPQYPAVLESGPFPRFELLNTEIPPKYRETVAKHMNSYARTFKDGELIIRPMIKYLEKNFETLLTEKAAVNRFKFFPPTRPSPSPSSDTIKITDEKAVTADDDITLEVANTLKEFGIIEKEDRQQFALDQDFISFSDNVPEGARDDDKGNVEKYMADNLFMNPIMIKLEGDGGQSNVRGGETFMIHMNSPKLSNIALLYGTLLGFTIKCGRCQSINAIKELRPWVDRFETCQKCSTKIPVIYEPKLVTSTNAIIGSVRIANKGVPVDILPCRVQIVCLACSGEEDNPPAIQVPIYSGETIASKFPKCYHSFALSLGQVSFIQASHILKPAVRKKKAPSGVVLGQPLPQKGACSHYSKSFRWYRFPCCGRAFPCDECHDEAMKRGEEPLHEQERAVKFLCGYCAREQSISAAKRCECGADWSKGATPGRTTHWEGGRGMRERTTMSRKDSHKFKGLSK